MLERMSSNFLIVLLIWLLHPCPCWCTLLVTGQVEVNGRNAQLIYDSNRNLTWLDYTYQASYWESANTWADNLSFTLDGTIFNDWKLPQTVRESNAFTGGYDIVSSDMGHLYYDELGNQSPYASGNYGLQHTGPFEYLQETAYWSSTIVDEMTGDEHYQFNFAFGRQWALANGFYANAMAVHPGRVGPVQEVSEPSSFILYALGLLLLIKQLQFQRNNQVAVWKLT